MKPTQAIHARDLGQHPNELSDAGLDALADLLLDAIEQEQSAAVPADERTPSGEVPPGNPVMKGMTT